MRSKLLSNSSRNREITFTERARTMNQTFRTKGSTNMDRTTRSGVSGFKSANKEDSHRRWFSPKSASSSKTKNAKIEIENMFTVCF